ncbi:fumarate hydratase C-terminal domain-containing protein [Rhodoplanes sp. Z2-YC6860]|uniref:fumarate hydratase C-terminal domain-containing protein n=1 Tax=Rhodoplanes sp. Z2-YC6860 TaxID=674703 RepID=UPI00078E7BAB|nr:fumarate hydratase C-terminal domain-containing protein [Rhodoplanes sp. Z2-YC6860]AMN40635.1 tartrate/fumarate subfamily Fe-S type hydro-lyase subunit beta [Rhodoplanes sp. Z2-YC6860]
MSTSLDLDGAIRLKLPISEADVRKLKAGDFVLLDGDIVITAGLPTHQRIQDYIDAGKPLPMDLTGGTLFHLGSYSQEKDGAFEVLYMNPTTSTRFNPFMPGFIRRFGLRMVGGKGGLDLESAKAMKDVGCVYLSFLGGGSALHSAAIKAVRQVAWDDLVAHYRLVKLNVQELGPLVVGIDSHGNSSFEQLGQQARVRMPEILRGLDEARAKAIE